MSRYHRGDEPHDVYWPFDAEGRVLYIGCSRVLDKRLEQHRMTKDWWPRVARVEAESFSDIDTAMRAEGAAIVAERPIFNRRIPQPRPLMPPIIRRNEPLHAVESSAS